ncbi:TetR/AcrR family transcriptional regulator [Actinomyces lilanjuaniae]|uniref:TetR/AcrR family transcriptional regulator n=1 Tax=Actinomyces lilanjuaniae TaxID=2321394 RepID=UPI001FA9C681|nr:TetR/AcrR family transcriptional regulator [Actinomyces lilanjuaniae]
MSPRGRRPAGSPDTRESILAAARTAFARDGYQTSLRGIARQAGVDPALVHHYFPDRASLFSAAVISLSAGVQMDLGARAAEIARLPEQDIGANLVRSFVSLWDEVGADRFAAVFRAATGSQDSLAPVAEFVFGGTIGPLMERVSPDRPQLRTQLVASQLIGMGLVRWVVRAEPFAALEVGSWSPWWAPLCIATPLVGWLRMRPRRR